MSGFHQVATRDVPAIQEPHNPGTSPKEQCWLAHGAVGLVWMGCTNAHREQQSRRPLWCRSILETRSDWQAAEPCADGGMQKRSSRKRRGQKPGIRRPRRRSSVGLFRGEQCYRSARRATQAANTSCSSSDSGQRALEEQRGPSLRY